MGLAGTAANTAAKQTRADIGPCPADGTGCTASHVRSLRYSAGVGAAAAVKCPVRPSTWGWHG
jgi:hypothetical protein